MDYTTECSFPNDKRRDNHSYRTVSSLFRSTESRNIIVGASTSDNYGED